MNLEERTQLDRFLQLLAQAQPGPKDPEAEALIAAACARRQDASYLLVQRVLQLEHELQAAQKGSLTGDPNAWGRAPLAAQPSTQAPAQVPVQQAPAVSSAWGTGMFGTVASTAAGAIAGSLLAQGIGSLLGNHGNAAHAAIPPGGSALIGADYGKDAALEKSDTSQVADDFDTSDGSDLDYPE